MDYKEINLNSYNKNAAVFSEYFKGLLDLERRPEFKKFISFLNGKRILDLGCGGGNHALWFKEQGLNVSCVDFSEKMIEMCKEKGLNAQLMDIEDLKFEENSFDGIWAVTSLLHVPKDKISNVVDKLSSILRKKGIIYVVVKEGEGEEFIPDKQNHETKRFFSFWNKEEFLKIFKDKFNLIEFEKNKVGSTIYLQAFFKNSKLT